MILCTAQISPCWQNPDETFKKIKAAIAEAVEYDASFIAFPEQVLTGWDPSDGTNAVQGEDGSILTELRSYARDYSIGILGSYREAHLPHPRNTAVVIGADGVIEARYSKIHLFTPGGEHLAFEPGEDLGIFTSDGCRCGLAICYDLRFADLFRLYRKAGVHLMLVPSAWPASRMKHFNLFTTARAAEFQMYVAGINTVGTTPVDQYSGGSLVVDPTGTIISQGADREELLFTEIDPELVETTRKEFAVFLDRKDQVYRTWDHADDLMENTTQQ
jgi:omega-amidase